MSNTFHKFPSTPHLVWLSDNTVRDDKVMTPQEAESFLSGTVSVEEKIDGANLGLSFSDEGELRFQNRGNWLKGKLDGQWERLRGWAATHETTLRRLLPPQHILFGEWCYARHSVSYTRLPDWFLAFDVYDGEHGLFWSVQRRNALTDKAGIVCVPSVAAGDFPMKKIKAMLAGRSAVGDLQREGLYLRRDDAEFLVARAKIVQPEFLQTIEEHWSKSGLTQNRLARTQLSSQSPLPVAPPVEATNVPSLSQVCPKSVPSKIL